MIIPTAVLSFLSLVVAQSEEVDKTSSLKSVYSVEGRVTAPDADSSESFYQNTRVIVNYGEFLGFIRFVLHSLHSLFTLSSLSSFCLHSLFIQSTTNSLLLPGLMDRLQ